MSLPIAGLALGLVGTGSEAAARAVLFALLTHAGDHSIEVLIPRAEAVRLLATKGDDIDADTDHIPALTVVEDLDAALRRLEAERIRRARLLETHDQANVDGVRGIDPTEPLPRLVLIATPRKEATRRLQATLTVAELYDIGSLLFGNHPAGTTIEVAPDGTVSQPDGDDPHAWDGWDGMHLFQLAAADAAELLPVIRNAHGSPPRKTDTPHQPKPGRSQTPVSSAPQPASTTPAVHLRVLGTPTVCVNDRELTTGMRAKAREMLTYLAVHPQGATRDTLLEALYPDVDQQHAVMRFHAALNDIRTTLRRVTTHTNAQFIALITDRYRIEPDDIDVDLWRFRAAINRASRTEDRQTRVEYLREAADAYGGELAAEQPYEWIEPEREAIRRNALETLVHLADLYQEHDPQKALYALERAITSDPYAEDAYRWIMTLHARRGHLDAVRATYRLLETRLEELNVDPDEQTQRLLHRLLRPAAGSPTATRARRPTTDQQSDQ